MWRGYVGEVGRGLMTALERSAADHRPKKDTCHRESVALNGEGSHAPCGFAYTSGFLNTGCLSDVGFKSTCFHMRTAMNDSYSGNLLPPLYVDFSRLSGGLLLARLLR